MKRKAAVFCTVSVVLALSLLWLVMPANAQAASPSITILPDGSVSPASVPIQRSGAIYTFTGDVTAQGISIQRSGITIDGAGHTLMGPYNGNQTLWIIGNGPNQSVTNETWSIGIDTVTNEINGLTIENLNVKNFSIGIYMWTQGDTLRGNSFVDCIVGILVSGANNAITGNYIANNKNGVFFGSNSPSYLPPNITIYNNSFVRNDRQLSGCVCIDYNFTEGKHYWDNGAMGNYWSDYNGTEIGNTGIGSTPYVIDPLNEDRYPLTTNTVAPPVPAVDYHVAFVVGVVAVAAVVATAWVAKRKRKKKPESPGIM